MNIVTKNNKVKAAQSIWIWSDVFMWTFSIAVYCYCLYRLLSSLPEYRSAFSDEGGAAGVIFLLAIIPINLFYKLVKIAVLNALNNGLD